MRGSERLMSQRIYRSCREPIRKGLTWDERWKDDDKGLINCWELGRELREKEPAVAKRAENGELPVLVWKGGVANKIKKKWKYGTLHYLAEWQGLRGEDLNIDLSEEPEIICSKTGMKVIYTGNVEKYADDVDVGADSMELPIN